MKDKNLFEHIDKAVRSERLYADGELKREAIHKRFHISRHLLNDLLRERVGMTFPQYINSIRMEEACELVLHHKELSINEIAERVGLKAPNMRVLFKQMYGVTPIDYRQHRHVKE